MMDSPHPNVGHAFTSWFHWDYWCNDCQYRSDGYCTEQMAELKWLKHLQEKHPDQWEAKLSATG